MKKALVGGVSTIGGSGDTTTRSFCRKYVQLLFELGFGGGKDCPIHEQSGGALDGTAFAFRKDNRRKQETVAVGGRWGSSVGRGRRRWIVNWLSPRMIEEYLRRARQDSTALAAWQ